MDSRRTRAYIYDRPFCEKVVFHGYDTPVQTHYAFSRYRMNDFIRRLVPSPSFSQHRNMKFGHTSKAHKASCQPFKNVLRPSLRPVHTRRSKLSLGSASLLAIVLHYSCYSSPIAHAGFFCRLCLRVWADMPR